MEGNERHKEVVYLKSYEAEISDLSYFFFTNYLSIMTFFKELMYLIFLSSHATLNFCFFFILGVSCTYFIYKHYFILFIQIQLCSPHSLNSVKKNKLK